MIIIGPASYNDDAEHSGFSTFCSVSVISFRTFRSTASLLLRSSTGIDFGTNNKMMNENEVEDEKKKRNKY